MTLAWAALSLEERQVRRFLIGESEAIRAVRRTIAQVAPTSASVLITGPSGSGKEMVARAIHSASPRRDGPFVAVNCGAIPRDLLESELFGHEKGAFTGAITQQRGRFEDAAGGTLFLDEIGDMPADMQVKLLRVIEERTVTRVGGRSAFPVDVRIISATHRDIHGAIDEARFREDLYYRLAVFPLSLPPLTAHRDDIPLLIEHFVRQFAPANRAPRFAADAIVRLAEHRWPGNVRELRNVIERAVILHPGGPIDAVAAEALLGRNASLRAGEREALWAMSAAPAVAESALPPPPADPFADGPIDLRALVAAFEHQHIAEALRRSRGVVADAARLLGLQRTTLIEKINKYGIVRELA